jgi:hypothetical protein
MKSQFTNLLIEKGVKYCFNEQEYDDKKLKFIIVGDNPGDTEYEKKRFFIGPSGQKLREHFHSNMLIGDFEKECIIFNKTIIHTTKTKELEEKKNDIGHDLFDNIQKDCAKQIAQLSNKLNLPILIFGKSELGPNLLFDAFWNALNDSIIQKENILVFNHPSYNHFFSEWDKFKNTSEFDSSIELLKQIGTVNSKKIKNKYKKTLKQ